MKKRVSVFIAACATVALSWAAVAQQARPADYPTRLIRVVSPVNAGGLSDIALRPAAQELSKRLGQPVIVENRPGAGGLLSGRTCAKSAPDGYTICNVFNDVISNAEFLFKDVGYEPYKDFVPITNGYYIINGFLAIPSLGVNNLKELIELSKKRPEGLNVASPATGITMFIQMLNQEAGAKFNVIPYKSGSEVANALLTKSVEAAAVGVGNLIPQVQAGNFKALSVDSAERFPLLPDTPTLKEQGYDSLRIKSWYGFVAPAGTRRDIIELLHREITAIYKDPDIQRNVLTNAGLEPILDTPEEFGRFLELDRERTARQVQRLGIKPQ